MKLYYLANARIPTEKAHGYQIVKMCESFADSGLEVELILPKRRNPGFKSINPCEYYGIKNNFKIKKLPCLDLIGYFSPLGLWIEILTFSFSVFSYLIFRKAGIIYSRDINSLYLLSFFKKNIFYEIHSLPQHFLFYKKLFKKIKGIITINRYLKSYLVKQGILESKIAVAPDGVDLDGFNIKVTKQECRKKLNLSVNRKLILYTGHFYKWKGVDVLAKATQYLTDDYLVVLVGGTEFDLKKFKSRFSKSNKILIIGYRSYKEIPYWLKASDVLVLPNSAKEEISKFWTSPLKMFEYMASQRPIIASDLPSIREVLNQKNAVLVEPDSPKKLAQAIKQTLANSDLRAKISKQAYQDVQKYTWQKRTKKILDFICEMSERNENLFSFPSE